MRSACIAVLVLHLLVGCSKSDPAPTSASSTVGQPVDGSKTSPTDSASIPQNLTVTLDESERPATREDWARDFRRRANSNIYDAFLQLTFWGESTDEEKRQFLEDIKTIFDIQKYGAVGKIPSDDDFRFTEFKQYQKEFPDAFYPKKRQPDKAVAPEPTDAVQITYPLTESMTIYPSFALGRHNGKYYICAFKSLQP